MTTHIVDPSLRPADPQAVFPLRRRVGLGLLVSGLVVILVGGFWPEVALWFYIAGIVLLFGGAFSLRKHFRNSEGEHDIRKLSGQH
jgi:uncharacterized membrane protein YiaA